MKPRTTFLLVIATICLAFMACKKSSGPAQPALKGQWKLVSVFDPFSYAGDSSWHPLPAASSRSISFSDPNNYKSETVTGGSPESCTGTYEVLSPVKIRIQTACATENDVLTIRELSATDLVVERNGTEGPIGYHYKAE